MKIRYILLTMLLFSVAMYAAQVSLDKFSARSDGNIITVEWKANEESSIVLYEIERSSDNSDNFVKVHSEKPKGSGFTYKFNDETAFLKSSLNQKENKIEAKTNFSYRIKIVYDNASPSYSDVTNVTHNINSVKRTWGMLKEMFR